VLELVLEEGTRLLVPAEDAERYLGAASRGGPTREGLGAWILEALRVYQQGPPAMAAVTAAGALQDSQLAEAVSGDLGEGLHGHDETPPPAVDSATAQE
jgi:hypothetical protein